MKKNNINKKVLKHVREDIHDYKHEIEKDRGLIKDLEHRKIKHKKKDPKARDPKKKHATKKKIAKKDKFAKVMHEWKEGKLHSGSKKGPRVTSQRQAEAIAFSESRKAKRR